MPNADLVQDGTALERLWSRWKRRAISIPAVVIAWSALTAASPVIAVLTGGLDLARPRSRWARCRAVAALWWFLFCEVWGLVAAFVLWAGFLVARNRSQFCAWNAALQRAWTGALFRGARWMFGLRLCVTGADAALPAPYLLFVRHASVLDTLLAAALIANPHRIVFRYVLKRALLWDPCLDVVGGRLRNAFVSRGRHLAADDIAAVRDLCRGLTGRQGVLIYPEGTRFSEHRRRRAVERLAQRAEPEIAERAKRFECVLPPRPGGVLALLEARPGLDVVFLEHSGLDSAVTVREFWRGELVGATIFVRIRRVNAAQIPVDRSLRLAWLFDEWERVDAWVKLEGKGR